MITSNPMSFCKAFQERFCSGLNKGNFKPKFPPENSKSFKNSLFVCLVNQLELCPTYMSKVLKERTRWLLRQRLCFGCLGKGHISTNFTNRRTCKVYNLKHPSSLHRFSPKEIKRTASSLKKRIILLSL